MAYLSSRYGLPIPRLSCKIITCSNGHKTHLDCLDSILEDNKCPRCSVLLNRYKFETI